MFFIEPNRQENKNLSKIDQNHCAICLILAFVPIMEVLQLYHGTVFNCPMSQLWRCPNYRNNSMYKTCQFCRAQILCPNYGGVPIIEVPIMEVLLYNEKLEMAS